jgi:D-alanine-D-alanine ligase
MTPTGDIYVIEVNPLPGLTPGYSDLCLIATAAGIEYHTLIGEILEGGLKRLREKRREAKSEAKGEARTEPRAEPRSETRSEPKSGEIRATNGNGNGTSSPSSGAGPRPAATGTETPGPEAIAAAEGATPIPTSE